MFDFEVLDQEDDDLEVLDHDDDDLEDPAREVELPKELLRCPPPL